MLEKLQAVWPVIRAHPWATLSIALTCFGAGFASAKLLDTHEIASLKADRDLFKDSGSAGPSASSPQPGAPAEPHSSFIATELLPSPPDTLEFGPRSVAERYLAMKRARATPLQLELLLRPYVGKLQRLVGTL